MKRNAAVIFISGKNDVHIVELCFSTILVVD